MAYTYVENTTFNKPNMTVYNGLWNGELNVYRLLPHKGYVLQDTTEKLYPMPVLDENRNLFEIMVNHYYRDVRIPLRSAHSIDNFVAVDESTIPYHKDQKFDSEDTQPDYEVM